MCKPPWYQQHQPLHRSREEVTVLHAPSMGPKIRANQLKDSTHKLLTTHIPFHHSRRWWMWDPRTTSRRTKQHTSNLLWQTAICATRTRKMLRMWAIRSQAERPSRRNQREKKITFLEAVSCLTPNTCFCSPTKENNTLTGVFLLDIEDHLCRICKGCRLTVHYSMWMTCYFAAQPKSSVKKTP